MLKILRKKGVAKKLLWVIAVVIILSFGVFGTANYTNNQRVSNDAGKIFGKKVSLDEFQKSLSHARIQAILRYGDNFDKVQNFIDLDSEAWDRLLLLHEAGKRRINISDEDVVKTIHDFEFFKNKEAFDPALYKRIVRYVFRAEPRDFEEGVRESLVFAKLLEQETSSLSVSDEEAWTAYQAQHEQAQASYILFSGDNLKKDISLEESEKESYFKEHKEDFRMPGAINVQYILAEYPPDADTAKKADAEAKIGGITDELQKEKDLEKAAEKHGAQFGESGFFTIEQPNLTMGWSYELLQRAFALEPDEISEPIETSKGYYIIKLREKKDAYIPEFSEVKDKVAEALSNKKAMELAKEKAGKAQEQIARAFTENSKANFKDVAGNLGEVAQTPLFKHGEYLPVLGLSSEFQGETFSLTTEKPISKVVETAKGYAIIHLDALTTGDKEKFEKEKEEFRKNLLTLRKTETFSKFLNELRTRAKLQDNIPKLRAAQPR